MGTKSPPRRATELDEQMDAVLRGSEWRGTTPDGLGVYRTEIELARDVAALTAQVQAQAVETAALRRELTELRASLARELQTQKIVLVNAQQSTTIRPGAIWLRHDALEDDHDGSPRPGSDLGLEALDTWTGVLCSVEANGLPHVTADLLATVEDEPYAGVVCHLADATREFSTADDETR
jgi:hypothetical protein